jgi:dihydrofolate synthase / folylpolyglutamate synthase
MITYRQTIRYLYGLQMRGVKLGLRNTRELLRFLHSPHQRYPCIHVAGTNGKGSTCAFLASMLQEAGYKVGLYTSPHLLRFTERIRINGVEATEKDLVAGIAAMRGEIDRLHATFFEATTALAFKCFADHEVEIAVIETGLGGRFDATNVVRPLVSVLTNISLEHTEYLGNTIRSIAREKAGIIKREVPAVTATNDPLALEVFQRTAERRRSKLYLRKDLVRIRGHEFWIRGNGTFKGAVGLLGAHQMENAALAVAALLACGTLGKRIGKKEIRKGLARVRENTGIRGRLEVLPGKPQILLDVAHNPAGITTLIGSLKSAHLTPSVVIFGALKDKNYLAEVQAIATLNIPLLCVTPRSERALSAYSLARTARKNGVDAVPMPSIGAALRRARKLAGATGRVLVTGSHFVVGPSLQALYGKKA